ncbi:MAG: glutaredoxin family protein [Archangiaceae bacterium]|nr:glutaredoxin family protein [Archangiaceae bacterium]
MNIQFYTKAGCPLCEEAEELLDALEARYEKIDIYRDQALFERYRYRVPVIRVGSTDVLELKFTLEDLKKALSL